MSQTIKDIQKGLLAGEVAIIKTDTLYGIVACADNREAVKRVYALKKRNQTKPCIILVASIADIPFDQDILADIYSHTETPVSVVVPVKDQLEWLTRGGDTLAYRVPSSEHLRVLLAVTGPLIAPSANPEGLTPARSVAEAKAYFGDTVMYLDGGAVVESVQASRIVRVSRDGQREWLR